MKTYIYKTILLIITIIGIYSCETVMEDFSVGYAKPMIVIEAKCSSVNDSATVYLRKTVPFLEGGEYPTISNATITIAFKDSVITLTEKSAGFYVAAYPFQNNTTYTINIIIDGKVYTAQSFMPAPVAIDSIKYEVRKSFFGPIVEDTIKYSAFAEWKDPFSETNFYKCLIFKNNKQLNSSQIDLRNDKFFEGDTIPFHSRYAFLEFDTVKVVLQSIDKNVHDYYTSLSQTLQGDNGFSAPENPKSNFGNEVLGYFNAYSESSKTIVIKAIE